MFKETFEYDDFKGNHRKETYYFDLLEAEVAEMTMSKSGGLDTYLQRISEAQDFPSLSKVFKELILKAVGYISDDGREFVKSAEYSERFSHTKPYSMLYMRMCTEEDYALKFWKGIIPTSLAAKVEESGNQPVLMPGA